MSNATVATACRTITCSPGGTRGQGPGHRGVVPEPARERSGRVHRREDPDPGAEPDRPHLADPARAAGDATHDCVRHATTTLFAALEVATGKATDTRFPRDRYTEFLDQFVALSSGRQLGPTRRKAWCGGS